MYRLSGGRFCVSFWVRLNIFLLLLCSAVHSDVAVDIVCLLDPSIFPVTVYDKIIERITNSTLGARTTSRADLITGAEAKQSLFSDSTVFRRFELLHVTRVHSVVLVSVNGGADVINKLKSELIKSIAESVGICGVESMVDYSVSTTTANDNMQWITNLPVLVAPIALVGWIITLVSCLICWFCVCCTTDSKIATVAEIGAVGESEPVVAVVAGPALPPPPSVSLPDSIKGKITKKGKKSGSSYASEMFPQIDPHTPVFNSPQPQLYLSIDFQHQSSRFLELRIPSFKGTTTT